ncbi:hypothetical protein WR25_11513 [Diploscapter pachys]|uniref:Uncharacterized protein n=1 Tax=Diploscapter pachys TaxID=2018661 RepID=A0A2A2JKG9_9BILA|nr:hypothetical protein WR25_11513 [Diploscapter pachys]
MNFQSLVIRERILGGAHPEVHYYLRFRGAIFCDLGQMDRCYDLWMRALHLQQINLEPLHIATISTLSSFQETFVIALDEHVINQEQISFVTTENIREIYDKICHELDRARDLLFFIRIEGHDHSPETDTKRLFLIALQLFLLIYRLNSVKSATQTEQPKQVQAKKSDEETIRTSSIDLTRLINLAKKLHVHILHLALKEGDSTESSRFPNVHVIRGLLYTGADPEELDESGSSPLHVLLRNKCNRASIAKLLLDYGCSLFARDTSDETIWELIWAKHPSTYSEIYIGRYIKLRGLAANAVMRNYNEETMRDLIPRDLGPFLSLH